MAENEKIDLRFGVVALLVLLAAFSRILPHPPNFSPIGGIALFGAARFSRRLVAVVVPFTSLWLSDLVINNVMYASYFDHFVWFYQGFYWTYGAILLIVLLGRITLKKTSPSSLLISSVLASVIFFLVSNFGVWASGTIYPKNLNGILACYTAGIPFFQNTLAGDLTYTVALFGLFALARRRIPRLQIQAARP